MVLFVAVFFTSAILLGALTFDFSRLMNLKSELQTSAEAGAHAGTDYLSKHGCGNYSAVQDTARAFAQRNLAMQGTVTVDTVEIGFWNPASGNFARIPVCNPPVINAMHVAVSRQASGLFMSLVGVTAPVVRARAWARICKTSPFPPGQPFICPVDRIVLESER